MSAVRKLDLRPKSYGYQSDKNARFSVQITSGGEPVEGIKPERIVSIEETIMEWDGAMHIHAWFVKNVQDGKDNRDTYRVGWDKLTELLSVCEKVITASHALPDMLAGKFHEWPSPSKEALRSAKKLIKNVNVAHRLLPAQSSNGSPPEYDEDYLKAVEETRFWILRVFADRKDGLDGSIHYSSGW